MGKDKLSVADKVVNIKDSAHKAIKECLLSWIEMPHLEEIIIIGRTRDGNMHDQIPTELASRFWWVGALDNLKSKLNIALDKDSYFDEGEE